MARGSKIIDTREMKDGDGNEVKVRIHMTTYRRETKFFATCPSIPLLTTDNTATVDETLALAKAAVAEVKAITWKRQLRVQLSATKPGECKIPKEADERLEIDYKLRLEIDEFETGLSGDKPVYRQRQRHHWSGGRQIEYTKIQEGSPAETSFRYSDEERRVDVNDRRHAGQPESPRRHPGAAGQPGRPSQGIPRPERLMETLSLVSRGKPLVLTGPAPGPKKKGRR
jgi:hypothetical protein